ncbi:MAG: hypothetical protein HN401_00980 [Euryarchaeota archaeon]|nr:hypothetical protein [Euryarchaeota archaeon]
MSADRSLLVLFGSQSGNAEDMAVQIGKAASKYNLEATVKGMDEVKIADLANYSRILITCSTWGEGEQPDNAEDLWQAANAEDTPSMAKCNFSVLALGDSSYEFYCESGIQWDDWLESKGATRVYQRVDCDVEYEDPAASWLSEALACMGAVDDNGIFQAAEIDAVKDAASGGSSGSISSPTESAAPAIEISTDGDRSMIILFGSQSGNSEDLASKFAKKAGDYGLSAEVTDMDDFDFTSLSDKKRVLIICSTWGEGEMPDNAEELWQTSLKAADGSLSGVYFSVLSLGDSSYEFYCQSGKDWDSQFEKLGATRLVERVDCDVDFDDMATIWASDALANMAAVDGEGVYDSELVDAIKESMAGGTSGASGADGFSIPELKSESMQVEVSIFRYDPTTSSTGKDTWVCAFPGHISALEMLRSLKNTQDGSLIFRDGTADDPSTAISINGRYILPGNCRIDSLAPIRNGGIQIRIEPLPGFEVIRDLVVDTWSLEQNREISEPWMIAATRTGANTPQGPIGTMDSQIADKLHSISSFHSAEILHASSDATPHSNTYLGPSVVLHSWARLNDPRTSVSKRAALQIILDGEGGIKSETDLASIRRQGKTTTIHDSLLECKTATLSRDGFRGRHGKHVWWYTLTVKSSGRVNDTMIFRQVLGPIGLMGNLFSGVTARMVLGFTRTGGSMFYDMLALVAPPAGLGKMPKQFNASVDKHHEVVAIFNEMDGRF